MNPKLISALLALLLLAGCSTVESRISGQADFNTWPPQVQQMVSAGQIGVGFTQEQVQVALGDPDFVFSRSAATGSYTVWSYRDRGPRFSFGVGMASYHGGSGFGTGVGVSNAGYAGEKLRVVFDQTGRVWSIEQITRTR
jgi:outer membrane protein assembly factor BamE (lipoprotein component of BamABCDE complex)